VSSVDEHVRRWLAAGILDAATGERIRAFESRRHAEDRGGERPGVLEVLVYLGVIVAGIGAVFLVGQNWNELESWARVAALAVPAGLALFAGFLLQSSKEPALDRAGQAVWLVAVGLVAGTVLVVGREVAEDGVSDDVSTEASRNIILLAAAVSVGLALALWVIAPSHLQVLALAASLLFLAQALGNWPDEFDMRVAGMTLLVVGLAGVAMAVAGTFEPGASARALFGALAVAGPYQAGLDGDVQWAELLTFVVSGGLVALSVARGHFSLTVVGVAGIFVALVTYVFEHFEDEIGAPVALMVSGGVVVAGVTLLVQLRGMVRTRRVAA
jgi:hypothetical protein